MSWQTLDKPWQECFRLGWESFKKGSIPIGAVVIDEYGQVVAAGRNMQHEKVGGVGEITRHKLSHAELNALLKVSEFDHPNIRQYTLYSSTEPCPLCFGALVLSNVRSLKFAARDRFAGGTNLNAANDYLRSKNTVVVGPFAELERYQITLHTVYELHTAHESKRGCGADRILAAWKSDCPSAVEAGIRLYNDGIVRQLAEGNCDASVVFDLLSE